MAKQALLHFKNVKKSFSGNVVLSGVDFEIFPGQIVALAGENGAGKSTLMNILFGMNVIQETGGYEGEIIFEGKPVKIQSPEDAMALGIGMVHQEFMLLPGFTVARNIKLNRENVRPNLVSRVAGKRFELLDNPRIVEEAAGVLHKLGMEINPEVTVDKLPVGHMQFVEIAREIDKSNLKLLVLDEPTARADGERGGAVPQMYPPGGGRGHRGHFHQPPAGRGDDPGGLRGDSAGRADGV